MDRREEVDRTDERRDRKQVQREDPEVLAMSRGELAVGERRVAVPAGVRRAVLGEEAQVERDPAEEEQPVRQCVEPREGDVPRSDHQRHEVVCEAGEDRHDDEEDHRGAVNREQLVVRVARHEVLVRRRELRAHQHCEQPAQAEEDERRADVEDSDPLVVGRRGPADHAPLAPIRPVALDRRSSRHWVFPCRPFA